MPGSTLARGNILYSFVIQQTLTPVSVAANTTAEQSFTVNGLQVGDQVSAIELQAAYTSNVTVANARVSLSNTLTVAFQNNTGGGVVPPAGMYYIEVNRLEGNSGAGNAV